MMITPTSSVKTDTRSYYWDRQLHFSKHPLCPVADSVLLVDEDEDTRAHCRHILATAGVGVIETDSFFKAFNLLKVHYRPKAIVTDFWVDGHSTEEFVDLLESKKSVLHAVPLVLMSTQDHLHNLARRLGVRHFLSKPVEANSLLAAVNSLVPH